MANVRMIDHHTCSEISFCLACFKNQKVYSEVSGLVVDVVKQVEVVASYDGYPLIPTGIVTLTPLLGLYNAGVDMEMPFCSKNRDAISQAVGPKQYDDRFSMCFKRKLGSFGSQLIRTPEYIFDTQKHPQNLTWFTP